ncbi:uncharacterized protein ACBR49_004379 [Aulostomus maculatus]
MPVDFLTVALGDSLTLNCTYNCSTGFVRGCWRKAPDNSRCLGILSKSRYCTVSLHLSNVTTEDLQYRYSCYTEATDHPQLQQQTQRLVALQLQGQTRTPNLTVTPRTGTTVSSPAKPKDLSGGEVFGIRVVATVTVAVATVLTALAMYLCLSQNRQCCICKGEPALSSSGSPLHPQAVNSPVNGEQLATCQIKCERTPMQVRDSHPSFSPGSPSSHDDHVTLKISTTDNQSEAEVPYADILITVRGVSTPELTQVGYLASGVQKEWRGDESARLQASRSTDRLHAPQSREVTRKMSTSSEYAVITHA